MFLFVSLHKVLAVNSPFIKLLNNKHAFSSYWFHIHQWQPVKIWSKAG